MSEAVTDVTEIAPDAPARQYRRVSLADLSDPYFWLIQRLMGFHPRSNHLAVATWLRGAIFSNAVHFLRGEAAYGLVEIQRVPLEERPIVVVHFVLAPSPDDRDDIVFMFPKLAEWAYRQNASHMQWMDGDVDAGRGAVKKVMGYVGQRNMARLEIEALPV